VALLVDLTEGERLLLHLLGAAAVPTPHGGDHRADDEHPEEESRPPRRPPRRPPTATPVPRRPPPRSSPGRRHRPPPSPRAGGGGAGAEPRAQQHRQERRERLRGQHPRLRGRPGTDHLGDGDRHRGRHRPQVTALWVCSDEIRLRRADPRGGRSGAQAVGGHLATPATRTAAVVVPPAELPVRRAAQPHPLRTGGICATPRLARGGPVPLLLAQGHPVPSRGSRANRTDRRGAPRSTTRGD